MHGPPVRQRNGQRMLYYQLMPAKPQFFGTDGVRGVAGEFPLDPPTVFSLGRAIGRVLKSRAPDRPLRLVLGEDTRESSAWISGTLAAGLARAGVDAAYAGVITTPGVAFLSRQEEFAGGVMVSASHNPYQDNGIKVLSHEGTKLSEQVELEIEAALEATAPEAAEPTQAPLEPIAWCWTAPMGQQAGLCRH